MKPNRSIRRRTQRGAALVVSYVLLGALTLGTLAFITNATQAARMSRRQTLEVQTTHLCEAGIQAELRSLWRPFKSAQNFDAFDTSTANASASVPVNTMSDGVPGVGKYACGVISVSAPDSYNRYVTIRGVGWEDLNNNGQLDAGEPQKTVDVVACYSLSRSQVFDYTYFVNNYGWMDGFGTDQLIVNGDMRANGNFTITNGSPTINGSIYASANDKLDPPAAGLINAPPVKWDNVAYLANNGNNTRIRQAYNSARMGAKGSSQYEGWRDIDFESTGSIVNNSLDGAVMGSSMGTSAWQSSSAGSYTSTLIDSQPTSEVIMPDLSNLSYYTNLSTTYVDTKATFADGTANPNYNQGAWVKVWNTGTGSYQTITTNGVLTGSAGVVGSSAHPILVHGPVTFTQDCVISGYVQGQGTIYTGRNVHITGSIIYKNPPDFRGNDQTAIDNANEKKDMVGLAARGSVIMGDTSTFGSYPLDYMCPPFTHGRYDDNGNYIPAFDARATDGTGFKKYQSVLGDSYIHSVSSGVGQVDAVLYTNFVGGGNLGTGGGGVTMNGSIISKDEAMVIWSLPMIMNYDTRIKERTLSQKPLIDINLPRSPVLLRSAWKDRGFSFQMQQGG